jgi:hypothetical protein
VVLLRRLIAKLHRVARWRDCSVNQLVNSGLAAYYSREQSGKLGVPSRPTPQSAGATYDRMGPAKRQQLVEAFARLARRTEMRVSGRHTL